MRHLVVPRQLGRTGRQNSEVPRAVLEGGMSMLTNEPSGQLATTVSAERCSNSVPAFYTCESFLPRRSALVKGGALSILLFNALSLAFDSDADHRTLPPLVHFRDKNPSLSVDTSQSHAFAFGGALVSWANDVLMTILATSATNDMKGIPQSLHLARAVLVSPNYAAIYFHEILVLYALDTNHDQVISAVEIASAPAALTMLDRNHDGKLSPDECSWGFPDSHGSKAGIEARVDYQILRRDKLAFMHLHPVLAALDANHDGKISAREIQSSSAALMTLDKNGDGKLTPAELFP
jgi:EF hand